MNEQQWVFSFGVIVGILIFISGILLEILGVLRRIGK